MRLTNSTFVGRNGHGITLNAPNKLYICWDKCQRNPSVFWQLTVRYMIHVPTPIPPFPFYPHFWHCLILYQTCNNRVKLSQLMNRSYWNFIPIFIYKPPPFIIFFSHNDNCRKLWSEQGRRFHWRGWGFIDKYGDWFYTVSRVSNLLCQCVCIIPWPRLVTLFGLF